MYENKLVNLILKQIKKENENSFIRREESCPSPERNTRHNR